MIIDYSRLSRRDQLLLPIWRWVSQVWDPLYTLTGVRELPQFLRDLNAYRNLPDAERTTLSDTQPQLHDRTVTHFANAHYFYVNAWAMRRVLQAGSASHVDIASQPVLSSLLSAVIPVTFLDYRPLQVKLDGLTCAGGDILKLPFDDQSIGSLSCLHVAEHIGLGRYGDPLNPNGTRLAARELARTLAPNGNLYFALPVGRPRLCFNAHRIHSVDTILEYFRDLRLVEFSALLDDGTFVQNVSPQECTNSVYACGMFWFSHETSSSVLI